MTDYTQKVPDGMRIVTCRKCGLPGLAERERYGAEEPVLVAVVHSGIFDPETVELTNVVRCQLVSDEHRQQNREVASAELHILRARCSS